MNPLKAQPIPLKPDTLQSLDPVQRQAQKLRKDAEKAAEQFEAVMMSQLVQSMKESLPGGNLIGSGTAGDIYSGLAEWDLARHLARNAHLGLKEQILGQLPKEKETGK